MSGISDHDRLPTIASGTSPDHGDLTRSFAHASPGRDLDRRGAEDGDADRTVISSQLPIDPVHSWDSLRPRELGHLLEGRRLSHFQLEQFIGGGGMGAVFRAQDTVLGRTVAVKVLAAGTAGNEETRQRFRNEAQSAARLDHPNIARVHYVGEDQGFNYIVFEFLEGKNLRDLVAETGPLPLADALRFTLQIAEALAHAWQRDIVHRDIKPSNVLATPEGQVKLVDMGLARLRDVAAPAEELTASGVTLGTFDYISPEQARDPRHADSRSDIYSLGCTLYFMLCGRPPFQGGTALQKLLMHQSEEPPTPREFRPDLPAGVELLLRRMLAKSPDHRFQNPAELIAAVTTLADELGIAVYPTTTVQLTVSGHGGNWLATSVPWLAPAVLLLVCVFVIDYIDRSASSELLAPSWLRRSGLTAPQEAAPIAPSSATQSPTATTAPPVHPSDSARPGETFESTSREVVHPRPNSAAQTPSAAGSPTEAAGAEFPRGFTFVPALLSVPAKVAQWLERTPLVRLEQVAPQSLDDSAPAPASATDIVVNSRRHESYASLDEAWTAAADGDVLEIHESGEILVDRMKLPLRTAGRDITLKAARGHRPILRVRTTGNPRGSNRPRVFRVDDGMVTLQDLELELAPELQGALGGWRLFELYPRSRVAISGCRLTFRSSAAPDADYEMRDHDDFFAVMGDTSSLREPTSSEPADTIQIELQDTVVRGGDTLLSIEGDAHVTLRAENGLFILRGYLYDGMQRDAASQQANSIDLDHVTADLGEGALCIKDINSAISVEATVHNSVLVGRLDAALVEHKVGAGDVPLAWQGDGNVYSGWGFFYRQHVAGGRLSSLAEWQTHWTVSDAGGDLNSSDQAIKWFDHPADMPPFEREPVHYVLDDPSAYPGPSAEGDAAAAGMILEHLLPGATKRDSISDAR